MNRSEIMEKIQNDTDFINYSKHGNSLKNLLKEYPTGVSDSIICKILCLSQTELDQILKSAIIKLRESVGVDEV